MNPCPVIAVANQKGGVGKTTTTINLAQAIALMGHRVLVVDLDPQGNCTQGFGVTLESLKTTIADLIRDRALPSGNAIYEGQGVDLIPSSPLLARVEREMVGTTNSELRLAQRLAGLRDRYSLILIDTPPTFGPLMNSALNAASRLLIPVDSGFFALMGIKELLAEVSEIQSATNSGLSVLGFVLTLSDATRMTAETWDELVAAFGEQVFETKIRRSVRLREAPALGRTIFQHDPDGSGAKDYEALALEALARMGLAARTPTLRLVESTTPEVRLG